MCWPRALDRRWHPRGDRNPLFLGDVDLPSTLAASATSAKPLPAPMSSSAPFRPSTSCSASPTRLPSHASVVVTVSKGIEAETLQTPHQILTDLGVPEDRGAVASVRPVFAREVASQFPTAVVAVGTIGQRTIDARDLFSHRFRVYSSDDVVSVELGGALENVVPSPPVSPTGCRSDTTPTRPSSPAAGRDHSTRRRPGRRSADLRRPVRHRGPGPHLYRRPVPQPVGRRRAGPGPEPRTDLGPDERGRRRCQHQPVGPGPRTARCGVDMPITEQVCQLLFEGKNPTDAWRRID